MNCESDLIAAIATAHGPGAVGLVRLSGPGALEALLRFFETTTDLKKNPRTLSLGRIVDPESGHLLDKALSVFFPGPASFTGEDIIEIQGHGGSVLPGLILEAALKSGARLARPGEFTQRAFLNGKLSLDQAEAVADLVNAQSDSEAVLAAKHLDGALGTRLVPFNQNLKAALAFITAFINFEEEWSEELKNNLESRLEYLIQELSEILELRKCGRIFRDGLRLVLAGAPNAGKSSLFNAFLGRNRALVSTRAGTTRDYLEATVSWSGLRIELIDTAGLRDHSDDDLETQGQNMTRQQISGADLIVWILDLAEFGKDCLTSELNTDYSGAEVLKVWNKSDLYPEIKPQNDIMVSARTGQGLEELKSVILGKMGANKGTVPEVVPNLRQQKTLEDCLASLKAARDALTEGLPPEIAELELTAALNSLGLITGRTFTEDLLAEVFNQFCLGK